MWYSTKYAISEGIVEIDDSLCRLSTSGNYVVVSMNGGYQQCLSIGRDMHNNKQDAIKRANEMRERKIASVKKQLLKLEKMSFV